MDDKEYICIQCDSPFLVTKKQLERIEMLGFDEPTRCPACRKRKARPNYSDTAIDKYQKKRYSDKHVNNNRKRRKYKRSHGEFWDFPE